jgi:hypothetical protein
LRPTIITVGQQWKKTSYASLLSDPVTVLVTVDDQRKEKQKAYDLLDSLTRSV